MSPETILWLIILVAVWSLPWKGVALWKSARNRQLVWFVVLLLVHTLAILEILYIFFFQRKNQVIRVRASPMAKKRAKRPAKKLAKKKRRR